MQTMKYDETLEEIDQTEYTNPQKTVSCTKEVTQIIIIIHDMMRFNKRY